ncbi:mannosyltransferase [Tamlana crocina]|uniref:Mannosyltransferase n=1 Tax=Tamlana crocina TaxID=393006 RepID=A0ABX1DAK3_9FLAO|nr:mannosyltransferase [Tamlana crocina]NJX15383.1 mannosyltransferase [Tamlana crocina]
MQPNTIFFKLYKLPLLLALSCGFLYWTFAYDLARTDYIKLLTLYVGLFVLFYKLVQIFKNQIAFLSYLAFGFRAIFILAIPNLSQDFYRFIWDGRMIFEGINPYLFTPESFISTGEFPIAQAQELHKGMGVLNASHFSNYPPINQLCFAIAALVSGKNILGSVVVMRLIIIAADFGTLFFGKKLLKKLNMPAHHIFWYVLNPFIIIELTGNLHFEGVMIFFLIWGLYLLHSGKWQWSAVVLALSISTKLIPLLFLPLFFQWFVKRDVIARGTKQSFENHEMPKQFRKPSVQHIENKNKATIFVEIKRLFIFYSIVLGATLLLFIPFFSSEFISNYSQTVALWFQNFEFNASLYYIARAIGYTFRGYNEIAIIGKFTAIIVFVFVLALSFLRKNEATVKLITAMLFALSFYYFTATTVHPWYLAMLLALSVFTNYKFPLVWTFMIVLSYLAYLNVNSADKSENLWIIALEYIVVYAVFIWEVFIKKATKVEA